MTKFRHNWLNLVKFSQGFETKLVVKRYCYRELVQLPVLTKHSGMCSVPDTAGRGESSNLHQDVRRSLSRATIIRKEMA